MPCANCFSTENIECDHKNDLKNNPMVLCSATQTIDDFQPLCKQCNDLKRSWKSRMSDSDKRISARKFGYNVDFTEGTDELDREDPYWYKGTYWGDIKAFKAALTLAPNLN